MANEYLVKGESLTAVADKIRILNGTTEAMSLDAMATNVGAANDEVNSQTELLAQAVAALEGKAGGGSEPSLQSKSVTPSAVQQTVVPDSGYDGLDKVTVAAIPSTYVKPTATKAATTYTPTTSNQTIAAGTYCSGAQTIKGDANLVAGNIKSGVSIFDVVGSYEGSGGGSSGGSADTCTVTINQFDSLSGNIIATQVENGVETIYNLGNSYDYRTGSLESLTINNVKCGSVMVIEIYDDFILPKNRLVEIDNGATVVDFYRSSGVSRDGRNFTTTLVLKVPTTANVNCVAVIM